VTRGHGSGLHAQESLTAILDAGIAMEARTTWHPTLLSGEDIRTIGHDLASRGVTSWAVQAYRHIGTTGELPDETVYPSDVPEELPSLFEHYEFRRA
jgi:pyruvate formate lyase activating enzyme